MPQAPAMRVDDAAADGQAHAHAVRLAGIQGVVQAAGCLRRDTGAIVGDAEMLHAPIEARGQQHRARPAAGALQGFDGVHQQVQDDLPELHRVGVQQRAARCQLRFQVDGVALQWRAQQRQQVLHGVVGHKMIVAARCLAGQAMHAAQHGAGMAAGAGDQGQRRARLVEAGRIVIEPAQGGIGIERDGRQRLAHLVHNR
ncbi:hypothetical protein D3C81_1455190 [compost metagenome]